MALQAAPVPPVPSRHSMGEPLEAVPLLEVPPVPSVPPHIHKAGTESRPRQREGVAATDPMYTAPSRMAGVPPGHPPPQRYSGTGWPLAGNSSPAPPPCMRIFRGLVVVLLLPTRPHQPAPRAAGIRQPSTRPVRPSAAAPSTHPKGTHLVLACRFPHKGGLRMSKQGSRPAAWLPIAPANRKRYSHRGA